MPLPLVAMAAKAAVPMLKKAAVKKLKSAAIKKAGQAISGATKGLVPSGVGETVAKAAAKKALPSVFENGGKMKAKKKKKKKDNGAATAASAAAAGAGAAVGAAAFKAASKKKKKKFARGGTASGMGSVFAEEEMFKGLDMGAPPKKKSNAAQLEEKSEEAGKKRPTKEERKARRQEFKGKAKDFAKGMRDRYEARAEKNKHHAAAMTAMSSYDKGGKMKPTDPKKKIKSMLEGGASDKEINAYLKKQGIDKTHDVSWDNVEMKVTMKPKKGDFGEPDKPGQRSDNFKGGGKLKAAVKAVRGAKVPKRTIRNLKSKKPIGNVGVLLKGLEASKGPEGSKPTGLPAPKKKEKFDPSPNRKKPTRKIVKAARGAKVKYDAGGKEKSTPTTQGGKKYSELSPASRIKLQKSLQAQLNAAKSSRYASPEAAAADAASIQKKITHLNKFIPKAKPTTKASFRKGGKS